MQNTGSREIRRWCGYGRGEPSPGADVAGASRVPAQMWRTCQYRYGAKIEVPSTHTGLFAAATPWLGAFPGALLPEGVGVLIVLCSGGFDFKAKSLQMGTSLSMILLQV